MGHGPVDGVVLGEVWYFVGMVDRERLGSVQGPCPERQLAHDGAGSRQKWPPKPGLEIGFSAQFSYFSGYGRRERALLLIITSLPCSEERPPPYTKPFFLPPFFVKLSEMDRHLQYVHVLE